MMLLLSAVALAASAAPLTWALTGVTFVDGSTASGAFVFDAGTNTYSSIDIVTTAGAVYPAVTFTSLCTSPCTGVTPDADNVLFLAESSSLDLTGTMAFALFPPLDQPLTDAGGTIPLTGSTATAFEALCADSTCSTPDGLPLYVVDGTLDAPEPASGLLIGTAVLIFGWRRFDRFHRPRRT